MARPPELRAPTTQDAEAIVAIACACDVEDLGAPDYDTGALQAEWADPSVVLDEDARVAVEPDGSLTGYALLLEHDVRAWVHPERRGRGAGTALREFAETRAAQRGLGRVRQLIASTNRSAHALLAAAGYAVVGHHWSMEVALDAAGATAAVAADPGPQPEPGPATVHVRPFAPGADDRAVHGLVEDGFADIEGHTARSFDAWAAAGLRAAAFDPELWWVAERGGEPVGALCGEVRGSGQQGWVTQLAVRRDARRHGVGSALLRRALAGFAARGLPRAGLGVRTSNAGGVALYEGLGFRPEWRIDELVKAL
jgi:ribosomal protein S18 acetylase RimI-like enzyme